MFTQPAPSPAGNLAGSPVNSAGPAASSTPPSRTSRLRGLSYLRSYTQTRHNSHSNSNPQSQSQSQVPPLPSPSSSSSPSVATNNPWFSAVRNDSSTTAAAPAVAPAAALAPADPSSRTNRLSQLVPALVHPLGLSNSSSGGRGQSGPAFALPIQRRSSESSAVPSSTGPNIAVPGAATVDPQTDDMARLRAATAGDASGRTEAGGAGSPPESLPSIRFSTFHDPRATRPSLKFAPIARTLPTGKEVIRVGRYSERDNQPNVPANAPSAAPVGFKSKVVSRRHCEFWYEDGKWYIKDVKSSSGTFLNHIRLSPPGTESKPYPVNDGDIVQMGIDFKGGEEMIFRCVKMRLELNRGWQNKLNTFNMATHKRLRNMTAGSGNKSSGSYSQDCSICLNSIAPCQCLFVAPCSHTWHYKCIRSLLVSNNNNPIFICPNCRASADLEADVEDPEEWEQLDSDEGAAAQPEGASLLPPGTSPGADPNHPTSVSVPVRRSRESVRANRFPSSQSQPQQSTDGAFPDVAMFLDPSSPPPPLQHQDTAMDIDGGATLPNTAPAATTTHTNTTTTTSNSNSNNITPSTSTPSAAISSHAMSDPVPIPIPTGGGASKIPQQQLLQQQHMQGIRGGDGGGDVRTPSPPGAPVTNGPEGPITPRNDAGPWVFDGSDLRLRGEGESGEGEGDGDDDMGTGGGSGNGDGDGEGGDRTGASTPSSLEAAVQAAGARLLRGQDEVL